MSQGKNMIKDELNRVTRIEYKIQVFENETGKEYLPQIGTRFVHDFINWMRKNSLTTLYSMEYIDPETLERKFELGNKVITRVSEEGANRIYEYDAKHVDSEAFTFEGVNRTEMIEKLQILEDSMGSTTFGIKYQIMKSVGLNTYNRSKREEKSMPAGFPIKN